MNTNRKRLTKEQLRELNGYYKTECVVAGGKGKAEWHHLDDDPINTVIPNMIPLGHRYNLHLRDVRKATLGGSSSPTILLPELEPDSLEARSTLLFSTWELGRAYGCARLAVFIARQYLGEPPDSLIRRSCRALYLTRHRVSYALMADVLERDILPHLRRRISLSSVAKFLLVRELAGILSEHGEIEWADELYSAIELHTAALPVDDQSFAGAIRRKATTAGALGDGVKETNQLFEEALSVAGNNLNLQTSVLNSRAWLAIQAGDFRGALELLEPIVGKLHNRVISPGLDEPVPINATAWNVAELFHNFAIALSGAKPSGYRARREKALESAQGVFSYAGSRPYELRRGFWAETKGRAELSGLSESNAIPFRTGLPLEIGKQIKEAVMELNAGGGSLR